MINVFFQISALIKGHLRKVREKKCSKTLQCYFNIFQCLINSLPQFPIFFKFSLHLDLSCFGFSLQLTNKIDRHN